MEENVDLKVVVQVQEAEQNLENLNNTLDETKDKVDDINDSVDSGIPTVGGLDKAFESVFNTVSKEGSKGGAVIKKIFDSVKNAIPTVKALNNTAITGLKGIKGAIAATGLGILVVLLGELIAHWDQFSAAIQKWIPFMREGHEETEKLTQANEDLLTANKEQNDEINFQVRLMKALGAEEKDVINYKIKETQALKANTEAQIKETEAKIASMKAHSAFRRWITGENKDIEKLEESLKSLKEENERLEKSIKGFNQDLIIEEAKSQTERTKAAKKGSSDRVEAVQKEAKSVVEELRKNGRDVEEVMEAIAKNLENKFQKESVDFFRALLDPKAPMKATEEIIPELEKAGVTINKHLIEGLLAGDAQALNDELEVLISQRTLLFASGNSTLAQDLEMELNILKKSYEAERVLLEKRKALILKYVGQGPEYQHIVAQLESLGNEYAAAVEEVTQQLEKSFTDQNLQYVTDRVSEYNLFPDPSIIKDYADLQVTIEQEKWKALRDQWEEGTEQWEYYNERMNKADKNRVQYESQALLQLHQRWSEYTSQIASLFGSLADIYEEDIKARQKREGWSEEETEREFKRVKNLQLAEVWINTLSGAVGAFLQASANYPPPYGQILGGITAASVLAAGIAQHAKIKNTSLGGGTGGGGGVNTPSVGVTPVDVRDDIQVSPTTLAQSQSPADQRVYILEGDIQDSNKRVEIREANSTF